MNLNAVLFKNYKMELETKLTNSYVRHVAVKVCINHIIQGNFVENKESSSYLETTTGEKLFRVNLMAAILGKEKTGSVTSLMLDDGSDQISLRFFEENEKINSLNIGNLVLVIGRVRVYNQEKYLSAEIVKIIGPLWLPVRKKEIELSPKKISTEIVQEKIEVDKTINENKEIDVNEKINQIKTETIIEDSLLPTEKIIKTIKELDPGSGVLIEEIIEKIPIEEIEQVIEKMLKEGIIFQIQPGRIKVL